LGNLHKAQIIKEIIIYDFNPKNVRSQACLELLNGETFRLEGKVDEASEALKVAINRPI